jgi:hypothetical protein
MDWPLALVGLGSRQGSCSLSRAWLAAPSIAAVALFAFGLLPLAFARLAANEVVAALHGDGGGVNMSACLLEQDLEV